MMRVFKEKCFCKAVLFAAFVALSACNSSSLKDAIDIIDGVPRKDIDVTKTGVNAFASDDRFGTPEQQMLEVRDTLKLPYVRILFAWTDAVQGSPSGTPNFGFYDEVLDAVPEGVDALIVLSGLPSWMSSSANWIDGNPRLTFVEKWVRQVIMRYKGSPRVVGWEIWNEPNMLANADNTTLDIAANPSNYVELLRRSYELSRQFAPGKLVVSAATTSINQNFPESLDYNRGMRDAGLRTYADVYGVHFYGKQYENVVRNGGVADYLNGLGLPIWITESGAQGVTEQLGYVEEVWPFLSDKIDNIQRFYYYQFAEDSASANTYGLRNLDPGAAISDLYVYLRDRE